MKCSYLSGRLLGLLLFFFSLSFFLDHKKKLYTWNDNKVVCQHSSERKRAGNWVLIGARDLGIVLGWTAKQRWRPPRVGKKKTTTTTTKKPKSHAIKNGYWLHSYSFLNKEATWSNIEWCARRTRNLEMQDSSPPLDTRSVILSPRPRSWITDWFASCYLGLFIMLPTTLFVAKRISNKIIITWMSCNLASWPWVIQTEKILLVTSYKNPNLFAIHAHNETRKNCSPGVLSEPQSFYSALLRCLWRLFH